MSLPHQVRRTIRRHGLLPEGTRVCVALSGGADSVALLLALREIAGPMNLQLAGIAHLNHLLRGAESDGDEAFCRSLAAGLDLPAYVECVDAGALARRGAMSTEQAAHDARNAFFGRAAAGLQAAVVATAHTRDDQAETFLLRLLRGAGPRGLSGMHPRSGLVVRPFIESARSDVRAYLEASQVLFREDSTNEDRSIPRNRIRHDLMPLLAAHFSPGIAEGLARCATIAREDAEYLDAVAQAAVEQLTVRTAAGIELHVPGLLVQPPAIARRVVRLAQQMASGGRFIGFDAVEAVLLLAVSNSTGPIDLPGHRANRRGHSIVLMSSTGRIAAQARLAFSYQLGVPGSVDVPEAACAISADVSTVPAGRPAGQCWMLAGRGEQAVLEADRVQGPLHVRNRRPGDRFRPLGLGGRKKLQDLFVDAKVGRAERDTTPVVVDATGRIVWVAGHALAEEFRVTDGTTAVVILKRIPA